MLVPQGHSGVRAESGPVGPVEFHDRVVFRGLVHRVCELGNAQALTGWSQWPYRSDLPAITSKKRLCSFSVTGPRAPSPIGRLSSSRIGVISAAVPVKK